MQKQKRVFDIFWFGLGLALGMVLSRRLAGAARPAVRLPAWERALAERYGVQKAAFLAARVQARIAKLFAGRPRFSNPALRTHLEERILPGIALYQVLLQETADPLQAQADLESCFSAHILSSSNALQARLLDRLPGGFATLRIANRVILRSSFPEQGWKIDWVEDSPQCIAYNITGCFYLNVLRSYGVPELTPFFCAGDDLLYSSLKTIAWERTETLGRGDARCNFVFRARARSNAGSLS